jgi:hypothetical protein
VPEAVRDTEELEGLPLDRVRIVMTVKTGRPPKGWMRLTVMWPSASSSKVAELCTRPPPLLGLAGAAGERRAGATGLGRPLY